MDVIRYENLLQAQAIIELMTKGKYKSYVPPPSAKFDTDVLRIDPERDLFKETDVEIDNSDSITTALNAVSDGYRPLILNMANAKQPGGGFLSGAKAQEEDLFRCTNLYLTLKDDGELYPMRGAEVIYSPKVHILRDSEYHDLEQPVEVGFISVAATKDPYIDDYGMLTEHIYNITAKKIRMAYHIGLIQRYDCLIMGALGCGAFNNPPQEIAKIFCEVTAEYAQRFKKIIFPIKCGPDNPNCDIFQTAFLEAFD